MFHKATSHDAKFGVGFVLAWDLYAKSRNDAHQTKADKAQDFEMIFGVVQSKAMRSGLVVRERAFGKLHEKHSKAKP